MKLLGVLARQADQVAGQVRRRVPELGFGEPSSNRALMKELSRVAGGGPDTVPPSVERKQRPAPTVRIISTRSLTGSCSVTSMNARESPGCQWSRWRSGRAGRGIRRVALHHDRGQAEPLRLLGR